VAIRSTSEELVLLALDPAGTLARGGSYQPAADGRAVKHVIDAISVATTGAVVASS